MCAVFCVNVPFHFSGRNAQEYCATLYYNCIVSFIRNCQAFPEWLYHLALLPAMCEQCVSDPESPRPCQHLVLPLSSSSSFIFISPINVQLLQHHLLKRLFPFHYFCIFVKYHWDIFMCIYF